MRRLLTSLMIAVALVNSAPAFAMQTVPAGNRHAEQPDIPGASIRRTKGTKSSFDLKYEKVHELLATDRELMGKIRKISSAYGISPIHVVGAIVGEHTYNVDAYDRLQAYYVKAASYAGESFRFSYDGESVDEFVARPQFSECKGKSDSYTLWSCREDVWETDFRGKTVGGTSFPNNRFSAVFFQPFYAGQTFGLGQVNPLTALMLSDLVTRVSGYPKLNEKNAGAVYRAIMDPDISLAFVAASIRRSIDDYKEIAGMDISGNPGLTATLYNVGNSRQRAAALAAKNRGAGTTVWPEENYYGWLINDKLDELKGLL
ncbi:DUF1402 family protein [Rhizobium leguminosarum bv. viciae]|uniref:DUF1402 family protein n=1 Tax=Rhizobium leguminosarum bv. viciae TaxID=387 RepID=A0A4R0BKD4_RHILV|nr:DUF1402 family protein [Rhizobium leguminosarum]ASR08497.1 hypothetical protein CHY08_16150 [Rhizobium leguminosarum bv. viciae]MBY5827423.1 DUF1402 family protein [Rhizobium leguminosarum]NKM49120.1 DUF1402 family protein [Rhizobium leguminosarum bv. viciae]NKN01734.1 DUF1402 family protein [Rhizobium leguminosarum bv. viciae]TBZ11103.1 DUF1402 family protein [Rhizobium leguminosarum bv. viciae]